MYGYHFLNPSLRLSHGDGRKVVVGDKLTFRPTPKLCSQGFHASRRPLHALQYASGPHLHLCRVRLSGQILHGEDKSVATERRVLWMFDATALLENFNRWCAAQVVHLWDAPEVFLEYLRTGAESLKEAAYKASTEATSWISAGINSVEADRAMACAEACGGADAEVWASVWTEAEASAEVTVLAGAEKEFLRLIPLARAGRLPTEVVIPKN